MMGTVLEAKAMRLTLAIGVLIVSCVSSEAAQTRRAKPPARHVRAPDPVAAPKGFAVPGWTAQQTQSWIDDATGPMD
jgi:hypothetical protein